VHPLLKRQLRRQGIEEVPEDWSSFVQAVNDAYEQNDADRSMLERSLELSSTELLELNAQMRDRAQELARSNAELEQFAYVASHDLQEPLRTITSYLQLIERRYKHKLDDDAAEFIDYTVQASRVMQQLIRDLLSLARVTSRAKPPEPTDLARVLDEVETALDTAISESGAEIVREPLPTVLADAGQLRQLLQNLVSNALKFRGSKPPRVVVSAERTGEEWRVAVVDNGIGIEPKYKERVFEIFKRLHRSEEYSGTGIGLAVCKKIVERHGGRIWLESEPGEGATFSFTVPAVGDPE
jgi:light-regulated signal transduction histidine kinase (bacteriophytochrome)